MLGLYLYTLIIGHKLCNMLNIQNKLTLQKKLKHVVTNTVFWEKTQQQQNKNSNIITLAGAGNWTRDLSHLTRVSAPPGQPKVLVVIELFNGFDAMGRNVNKQRRICITHFLQIHFFCNIITFMDNYIWQFLIFTGVGFTSYIWLKCKM